MQPVVGRAGRIFAEAAFLARYQILAAAASSAHGFELAVALLLLAGARFPGVSRS